MPVEQFQYAHFRPVGRICIQVQQQRGELGRFEKWGGGTNTNLHVHGIVYSRDHWRNDQGKRRGSPYQINSSSMSELSLCAATT